MRRNQILLQVAAILLPVLLHLNQREFCIFEASEEHFPFFLRDIFIKVVNYLHLKIQDFVLHFIALHNFIPLILKQRLLNKVEYIILKFLSNETNYKYLIIYLSSDATSGTGCSPAVLGCRIVGAFQMDSTNI
jgi:hypothetical protein